MHSIARNYRKFFDELDCFCLSSPMFLPNPPDGTCSTSFNLVQTQQHCFSPRQLANFLPCYREALWLCCGTSCYPAHEILPHLQFGTQKTQVSLPVPIMLIYHLVALNAPQHYVSHFFNQLHEDRVPCCPLSIAFDVPSPLSSNDPSQATTKYIKCLSCMKFRTKKFSTSSEQRCTFLND